MRKLLHVRPFVTKRRKTRHNILKKEQADFLIDYDATNNLKYRQHSIILRQRHSVIHSPPFLGKQKLNSNSVNNKMTVYDEVIIVPILQFGKCWRLVRIYDTSIAPMIRIYFKCGQYYKKSIIEIIMLRFTSII